jgi:fimbrial chaperone protein
MVLNLPLTKPQASGTYTVENNSRQKIAVEFRVTRRLLDDNGREERPPATGFLVYPEQMALEPGEKRNVRVTWTGEAVPDKEEGYRLVAAQLPVEFTKDGAMVGAQLKFLMEYVASLYLVPPKVRPKMRVVKHQVTEKGVLEILVANEGTAHFLLERMEISYRAGAKKGVPEAAVLNELRTENLLPDNQRWLRMPLPKGFPRDNLQVSVVFEP